MANAHKTCRHGVMIYNPADRYIGRSLELYGEFSQGEIALFEQVVRRGDIVVEVGANIGAHTVRLAQLAGPTGLVYAFEPQRVIFQMLCGNLAINTLENVVALWQAVGAEPGTVQVPRINYQAGGNFGGLELGPDASWRKQKDVPTEPVPVVTLDSLNLPRCRLIKVDVEGMELDVLKGARDLITRTRPLIYVENDRPNKAEALVEYLRSLDYNLLWHDPALYNPQNFADNKENVFGPMISLNVFCVPNEAKTQITGFRPLTAALHPIFLRQKQAQSVSTVTAAAAPPRTRQRSRKKS